MDQYTFSRDMMLTGVLLSSGGDKQIRFFTVLLLPIYFIPVLISFFKTPLVLLYISDMKPNKVISSLPAYRVTASLTLYARASSSRAVL